MLYIINYLFLNKLFSNNKCMCKLFSLYIGYCPFAVKTLIIMCALLWVALMSASMHGFVVEVLILFQYNYVDEESSNRAA